MTAPTGYTPLPDGWRCKCMKLWQERDESFWCCGATPVEALTSTHTEPPMSNEAYIRKIALAICKSRTCEGGSCCEWPANYGRVGCNAKQGAYDDAARAAIETIEACRSAAVMGETREGGTT